MSDRTVEEIDATDGVVFCPPVLGSGDTVQLGVMSDGQQYGDCVELNAEQAKELRDLLELRIAELEGAFI